MALSFTAGVPLAIATLLLLIVVQKVSQFARLRAFEGPKLAAWTKIWLLKVVQSSEMHHIFHQISTKYGTSSEFTITLRSVDILTSLRQIR